MCSRNGLVYTRYVDDITLSGSYPIVSGSVPRLVREIIGSCGFKLNTSKDDDGRLSDGKCITKLRINRGRVDVRPDYLAAIHLQLNHAAIWQEPVNVPAPTTRLVRSMAAFTLSVGLIRVESAT